MSDTIDGIAIRNLANLLRPIALDGSPAWARLEPQSASGDPTPGLEARVHDPLWLLCRQWQMGEFQGDDAGTPLTVSVRTSYQPISAWRAGLATSDAPGAVLSTGEPLEPYVEREATIKEGPGLRQRAEAGALLVSMLAEAGLAARTALLAACPLALRGVGPGGYPGWSPPRLFTTLQRSCPDGELAASALEAGVPSWLQGAAAAALEAARRWLSWYRGGVSPRVLSASWIPERLEHRFAIRAGSGGSQLVFDAPSHDGGDIDWYTFDQRVGGRIDMPGDTPAVTSTRDATVVATPLRYAGMPADRLWQFEEGSVNLGQLDTQIHDLARLCLVEFAMVYGSDWFIVPVDVDSGSFARVEALSYVDTFGVRTVVPPIDDRGRSGRFRLFEVSVAGGEESLRGLLIPPSATGQIEGRALEEVEFVRDEAANMAWALETVVQVPSGDPRSRRDEDAPETRTSALVAPAELMYQLQTPMPKYWIPLLPVQSDKGSFVLRKGSISNGGSPLGMILNKPLSLCDEEVPREGVRVRRVPLLARTSDGRYVRWTARRVAIGRGEGASGLAFDSALKPGK